MSVTLYLWKNQSAVRLNIHLLWDHGCPVAYDHKYSCQGYFRRVMKCFKTGKTLISVTYSETDFYQKVTFSATNIIDIDFSTSIRQYCDCKLISRLDDDRGSVTSKENCNLAFDLENTCSLR